MLLYLFASDKFHFLSYLFIFCLSLDYKEVATHCQSENFYLIIYTYVKKKFYNLSMQIHFISFMQN